MSEEDREEAGSDREMQAGGGGTVRNRVWNKKGEEFFSILTGMAGGALLLYLFFRHPVICLLGALAGGYGYWRYRKKAAVEKRRWELMVEFKDAMDSMVSALAAGYSMENAVTEAYHDLLLLHEETTPMLQELKLIRQGISLHKPLDQLLLDFGSRSGVEDIQTFAQIYATARRSGGNLVKVMKRTAENIGEKMEMQREIQTMIAGKRMESVCMTVIPLLIIIYLQVCSPGFLDPLYESLPGRLFMSVALVLYGASALWCRRIMKISC